jgi:hypothetical protein
LKYPVKTDRLLRLLIHALRQSLKPRVKELLQRFLQMSDVTATMEDRSAGVFVLE